MFKLVIYHICTTTKCVANEGKCAFSEPKAVGVIEIDPIHQMILVRLSGQIVWGLRWLSTIRVTSVLFETSFFIDKSCNISMLPAITKRCFQKSESNHGTGSYQGH